MDAVVADVAQSTVAMLVGAMLLRSGVSKLRDIDGAVLAVLDYRVVAKSLARVLAPLIAAFEVTIGTGTLLGFDVALAAAVLLLALFAFVVLSAVVRGLVIDCHCGATAEVVGAPTVVRNALLASLLAAGLLVDDTYAQNLLVAPLPYAVCIALTLGMIAALAGLLRLTSLATESAVTPGI